MSLGKEAVLDFESGDYFVVEAGDYVICAVTQKRIPMSELKYWDAETQEAYIDNVAAAEGHKRKLAAQEA